MTPFQAFAHLFGVLVLFARLSPAVAAQENDILVLGVHPYLPATELHQRFTPLANYLSDQVGKTVVLRIAGDYQEHIDQIGRDKLDLAFMGPAPYVKMVTTHGKKPLLARLEIKGKPFFRGRIIARKDSPLRNLTELQGRRFAFGDPGSTMSYLLARYLLNQAGVSLDKLAAYRFVGSHSNVALGVLMGDFDAGAVKEEIFRAYAPRGLKELAKTPPISEHLFVASDALTPPTVQTLRKALLGLQHNPQGAAIMRAIKPTVTGMAPTADEDYDVLRDIMNAVAKEMDTP